MKNYASNRTGSRKRRGTGVKLKSISLSIPQKPTALQPVPYNQNSAIIIFLSGAHFFKLLQHFT